VSTQNRTAGERLIVHVAPFYPPRLGGMERVAQQLAELLAQRHRVEVITTDRGADGAPAREWRAGVYVRRYPAREVAHTALSSGLVLRLLALPRDAIVHAHIAQAFVPEMVWLTSALRRRPFIVHFHLDVDPSGPAGVVLPAYKRWVLSPVLRRAAAVVALSQAQSAFLQERHGVDPRRITVIPNGVAWPFVRPDRPSSVVGEPLRLLFVGRLDAQKNVVRLIDAMRHVTAPVVLVIVGDGEQRPRIAERLRGANLPNVRLVGAKTGAELHRWYEWAEAFVLPSDKEGMPLVLLEAMAAGLALVATDVPGTRELVDGVGILAAPDPVALGTAIERVAADPVLRARLAAQSAACAGRHSWHSRLGDLESLYERVALAE
jgi:glycosyltransferase involved in cell wall biosynthesis